MTLVFRRDYLYAEARAIYLLIRLFIYLPAPKYPHGLRSSILIAQ